MNTDGAFMLAVKSCTNLQAQDAGYDDAVAVSFGAAETSVTNAETCSGNATTSAGSAPASGQAAKY